MNNKNNNNNKSTLGPYLCTNAMRSAARPDPSQTTTGTGGVSVTYSKTARIVFVPPSMTKHTTGVLECVTKMGTNENQTHMKIKMVITKFRLLVYIKRARERVREREKKAKSQVFGKVSNMY